MPLASPVLDEVEADAPDGDDDDSDDSDDDDDDAEADVLEGGREALDGGGDVAEPAPG